MDRFIGFIRAQDSDDDQSRANKLEADWKKRHDMMCSSGVFHLFAALWPDAEGLDRQLVATATQELTALVRKQWHAWQRHPQACLLPIEYRGANCLGQAGAGFSHAARYRQQSPYQKCPRVFL